MTRKNLVIAMAALIMVTAFMPGAQAGWFGKKKDQGDQVRKHRFDVFPVMGYQVGTLRRDGYSGWTIDGVAIRFRPDTVVTEGGLVGARLHEGRQALVMGSRMGKTMVAWRVRIMDPEWQAITDPLGQGDISWSESDPSVGVGPQGPQ